MKSVLFFNLNKNLPKILHRATVIDLDRDLIR